MHQESPRSDIFRKGATKQILKQKHSQKHFTWAKEKNNWTFAQWSKILFSDKSTLKVSSYLLDFRALYVSICWQALWRCWFPFSSRTLASAHTAKTNSKWFAVHDISVLDWPANMPDLKPIWNLWDIFKRKITNTRSNNTDELKAQ